MGSIVFERATSTLVVRNPLRGYAAEEQRIEVRRDPLLGGTAVLNPALVRKSGFFVENDRALIARLAAESAPGCPFCTEALRTKAARYPDEVLPGGSLGVGEATLVPNLFGLGAYHPVVVLSKAHFLELAQFTPRLLTDGLLAVREFIRLVQGRDPAAAYAFLGANYLPPAGASLVHPHLQLLVTPQPYTRHARLLEACRAHHDCYGTSLLADLAQEEQERGERFIGRRGGWRWCTAFAPQGWNEILAVHDAAQDLAALPDGELRALAEGIAGVLATYAGLGAVSFNWGLFSVREGIAAPGARCFLRVVCRQNLAAAYRNDDYFLQKLLDADVVVTPPEQLAEQVRAAFARSELSAR